MKQELKLPKYLQERFGALESEPGLIDDCRYMLYFAHGWCWEEDYWALPVRSKKEAIEFLKEGRKRTPEEMELHP